MSPPTQSPGLKDEGFERKMSRVLRRVLFVTQEYIGSPPVQIFQVFAHLMLFFAPKHGALGALDHFFPANSLAQLG